MNGTSKHDVDSTTKRTGIDGNLPSLFLTISKIYDGTFFAKHTAFACPGTSSILRSRLGLIHLIRTQNFLKS